MRFKIFIITLITIFSFSVPCQAVGFDKQLGGRAINVIECNNSIDIFAHISFGGEIAGEKFPNSEDTYGQAFIKGVKKVWEGSYKGKPVYVHIYVVPKTYRYNHIKVLIDSFKDKRDYSHTVKPHNTIFMYSGDGRDNYTYSYDDFAYVSGHEFAHILGLADAYSDKNEYVRNYLLTPTGAWNCFHAQDVDYYFLLKYRTWEKNNLYEYGNDSLVVRLLMKQILS